MSRHLFRSLLVLGAVALIRPSSVTAQEAEILGPAGRLGARAHVVQGHERPVRGQMGHGGEVFHERVVVQPLTNWAQRGQEVRQQVRTQLQRAATRRAVGASPTDGAIVAPGVFAQVSSTLLPATARVEGTMRQAVIFVSFTPDSLSPDTVANTVFPAGGTGGVFEAYWGTGGGRANWTTVPEFFRQASGGRFTVAGDTIATVRVSRSMASFMAMPIEDRYTSFFAELADSLRVKVPTSVFERFTERLPNGFRIVTPIAIVHTGVDGACGNTQGFWAHRSTFPPVRSWRQGAAAVAPMPNGAMLGDYILQGARCAGGPTSNEVVGPGIVIHETGHLLNLADFYNTNTTASGVANWDGGIGTWDIMSGYSTLAQPSQLGAFHRAVLGWATVRDITVPASGRAQIDLSPVRFTGQAGQGDTVLVVRYSDTPQEVLLVEHRTRSGTDRTTPDAGGVLWYANLAKLFEATHLATPQTVRGYRATWSPNNDPTAPGLIVLPRGATWTPNSAGRPVIPATTTSDAGSQRAWLSTAAWGTRDGSFGPSTPLPWRSFVTGRPGTGVIEQITWSGTATEPLRVVLRGLGALDTLSQVGVRIAQADTARAVAGIEWAGVAVTPTIPRGVRANWVLAPGSPVETPELVVDTLQSQVRLRGRIAMGATSSSSVVLQLTLQDAYTTRQESVLVPLQGLVVRPWTRLDEASRAFLRGEVTGDAALFVDRHGNRNGQSDLGDLQQLFAKRIVVP